MALPEYISIVSSPKTALKAIKSAWDSMIHLHPGDAITTLAKLAGDVLTGIAAGLGGYLIYDILKNNNLKTYQKVLPIIGFSLAAVLAIPTSIALIVGASFLVPPFMFVASVGATIRNTMVWWSERKERNILRKEMQTTSDIERVIRGLKLNPIDKEKLNTYTFQQQKIYQSFYQLRSMIMKTTSISLEDRRLLVSQINKAIEEFSKDNNKGGQANKKYTIDINTDLLDKLPVVKEVIEKSKEDLEQSVQSYYAACIAVSQMPQVPSSVLSSINKYKFTREKVVSQDLPEYVKNEIIGTLDKEKVSKSDIKLLYSQLGNHYLNITADLQLKAQDDDFEQYYLSPIKDAQVVAQINQYLKEPRELVSALQSLNRDLNQDMLRYKDAKEGIETLIQRLIEFPDSSSFVDDWSAIESQLAKVNNIDKDKLEKIRTQLMNCQQAVSKLQNLDLPLELKTRIYAQKQLTLTQHANLGLQFESPHIDFDLKRNNIIKRATDYLAAKKDRILKKDENAGSLVDETINALQEQTISIDAKIVDKDKLKENAAHFKRDFTARFANTFDVIEKKERLRFLEHAVPKRLANVGLCVGMSVLSFASSVLIPAVTSPVAPVAAAALTALGVVSGIFTAVSISISLKLGIDLLRSEHKVNQPKDKSSKGVAPDIAYAKKQQAKYAKELAKKEGLKEKAQTKEKLVVHPNPLYESSMHTSPLHEAQDSKDVKPTDSDKDKESKHSKYKK